jgi:hypothetical protein
MGPAIRDAVFLVQVATRHVEYGIDVQVSFILPQLGEADALSVT